MKVRLKKAVRSDVNPVGQSFGFMKEKSMGIFSFRRKNGNETQEERFRRSMDRQLSELLGKKEEELSLLQTISREVRQNSADIRKHDMALEDCLEALEEQQEKEAQGRKRIEELEEERDRLLKLLEVYQEQVWSMRRYASEHDPAWMPQLEISKEAVKGKENLCGIARIEETGVRVDYDIHEVIEARETADGGMAQTVAEVCRPGYLYKGEVKRKAKVIAYRLENSRK